MPNTRERPSSRFRILAIDVDGTLLDRSGAIRPATRAAVHRAAEAGVRPVLCTGRRFRRALPIAVELGIDSPLVCNSGALVKEPLGRQTTWRADLDTDLVAGVLAIFRDRGSIAVSFTDKDLESADFLTAGLHTGRPLVDDYLDQNHAFASVEPAWIDDPAAYGPHFHVCAIGDRAEMLEVRDEAESRFGARVTTFVQRSPRYLGTMCEVLRHDANKWTALSHLATLWGVDPREIAAVGDDMNDIPMLRGAGLGVAMGHAPPVVREAADLVTLDEENDGLARFIEDVLLA